MNNMTKARKIMVTGMTGFIPSITTEMLLENDYEVVGFDNLSNSSPESLRRVEKVSGRKISDFEVLDMRDAEGMNRFFARHSDTFAVIHFAGLKAVGDSKSRPQEYYLNNFVGSMNVYAAMMNHGIGNIVFSSSATVYQGQSADKMPLTEDLPLLAELDCAYAKTKLYNEGMLRDYFTAKLLQNVMVLRYFNPAGAHPSGEIGEVPNGIPNNLFPRMGLVALGTESKLTRMTLWGMDYPIPANLILPERPDDRSCRRDYIHVVDLARAHIHALDHFDGYTVLNIGTGVPYSVLQAIDTYRRISGREMPVDDLGRRGGDAAVSYADPSKALRVLGFRTELGIEDMCRDDWKFRVKNPNGYR